MKTLNIFYNFKNLVLSLSGFCMERYCKVFPSQKEKLFLCTLTELECCMLYLQIKWYEDLPLWSSSLGSLIHLAQYNIATLPNNYLVERRYQAEVNTSNNVNRLPLVTIRFNFLSRDEDKVEPPSPHYAEGQTGGHAGQGRRRRR